jgi:hypothetical protein
MGDEYSLEGSAPTFAEEEIESPLVTAVDFDRREEIPHVAGVFNVDGIGICVIMIPKTASELLQSVKDLL